MIIVLHVIALAACTNSTPDEAIPLPTLSQSMETASSSPIATFTLEQALTSTSTPSPIEALTPTPQPAGQLLARLGKGKFLFFAYSPEGKTIAVLTELGIYLYTSPSLDERTYLPSENIDRIFYRADGQLMASSWQTSLEENQAPGLYFWEVSGSGLDLVAQAQGSNWAANAYFEESHYQISPDGLHFAILNSKAKQLEIWQISNASLVARWNIPQSTRDWIVGAADPDFVFSPDSNQLAFCDGYGFGGNITVLSVMADRLTPTFTMSLVDRMPYYKNYNYWPGQGNYGIGLAFSPDGKQLATGGPDNIARVWDLGSGQLVAALQDQSYHWGGTHVSYSPDGKFIIVINHEGLFIYTIRNWKLHAGLANMVIDYPLTPGGGEVIFSSVGSLAATSFRDKIYITDLAQGVHLDALTGFGGPFWEMAVSDDGRLLAVAGQEINLFDLSTREAIGKLDASNGSLNQMTFSTDGQYLAATMNFKGEGYDGWAQIWRIGDSARLQELDLNPLPDTGACVGDLAYSPDGTHLAIQVAFGYDSYIELWQINPDGTAVYQEDLFIPGSNPRTSNLASADRVAFSPDGQSVISISSSDFSTSEFGPGVDSVNIYTHAADFTATGEIQTMQVVESTRAGWAQDLQWVAVIVDNAAQVFAARAGLTNKISSLQSVPDVHQKEFVVSPNLEWVAMIGDYSNAWLWSLSDGRLVGSFPQTHAVVFPPDGSWMAATETSGAIALWTLKESTAASPLASPTATQQATACASGWTRLTAGGQARLIGNAGDPPNRVRSAPVKSDNIIGQIYPGTILQVIEGPVCADGLVFWKVTSEAIPGGAGWTAEGDGIDYWLEPYTP